MTAKRYIAVTTTVTKKDGRIVRFYPSKILNDWKSAHVFDVEFHRTPHETVEAPALSAEAVASSALNSSISSKMSHGFACGVCVSGVQADPEHADRQLHQYSAPAGSSQ